MAFVTKCSRALVKILHINFLKKSRSLLPLFQGPIRTTNVIPLPMFNCKIVALPYVWVYIVEANTFKHKQYKLYKLMFLNQKGNCLTNILLNYQ